jgi:5'-phosphate synthase pdxT subunit
VFSRLGIESCSVKVSSDLDKVDGLVLPGGESTTISLLLDSNNMNKTLIDFGKSYPVMGTCAGLIMMAKTVSDGRIKPLGLLDIVVDRNAYGRQIQSSKEMVRYNFNEQTKIDLSTTLIRAPKIIKVSKKINVLGKFDGTPVAVLSGHHLGLTFHPELDEINIFQQILFDSQSEVFYKKKVENSIPNMSLERLDVE